jgi:hypothetical protein
MNLATGKANSFPQEGRLAARRVQNQPDLAREFQRMQ